MVEYIAEGQGSYFQAKFITITGDYSPHDVWDNTYAQVFEYTTNITNTFKDIIGKEHSDIEFYPAIGSHDLWPSNEFDFGKQYNNRMVGDLKAIWYDQGWLSRAEMHQFMKFGYYSKPLSHKGRVIVLNTNAANSQNSQLLK